MPLLQTTTAEGALKGMILGRAPHELQDQEVAYLQDALIHRPGFVDRRGAINGALSLGTNLSSKRPAGICTCYDPQGNLRVMVLYWRIVGTYYALCGAVYSSSLTLLGNNVVSAVGTLAHTVTPPTNPGRVVLCTPSIDGGVLISAADGYGPQAWQSVVHWWGGYGPSLVDTAVGSVTLTTTAESALFTGTTGEIAKLKPGVVVYNAGIVKEITSTTAGSFISPNPNNFTGASTFNYGVTQHVGVVRTRGKISTSPSASAGTGEVTGYGTRWKEATSDSDANPSWWIIRNPTDGSIIGASAGSGVDILSDTRAIYGSVFGNRSMVPYWLFTYMGANPSGAFRAKGARPFALPVQSDDLGDVQFMRGWVTSNFRNYNLYANSCEDYSRPMSLTGTAKGTGRTWIGGPTRHDEFDHSHDDGNFFDVVSAGSGDSYAVAAMGGAAAHVTCKARETFALTGDDTDNFVPAKISDDGALSANAITRWQGSVIWLGRDGIWKYDGNGAPVNLVAESLGPEWAVRVAAFQTEGGGQDADGYPLNQAHCFVFRDHLFVNITNTGSTHKVYTDGVARTSNTMQLMIYLPSNALSFLTNFNFVGYTPGWPPNAQQEGYVTLVQEGSTTHYLYPMSNFFTQGTTSDGILTFASYNSGTLGTSVGPWFHLESRKFDAGDGLWKKSWKQLAIEFNETLSKRMFLETVSGLNTTGVRAALPFTGTGAFLAARVKFRSRDQYMSFRLYEDINNRPATLRLGAWQWAYKFARRGAV